MRTLKRTLCLVLALVMVLGLGVTNAFALTADDFTDLKDAQHEEAIRVLTAIGVISGNGDGTLTPTATLTRGQMAVIITKLMGGLGNKFIPSSSFSDVKGHYAERYIAFCEANNIVRGDIGAGGTYRPDDPVTGYQLGVMLLSVMGYNMDYEVKGKDWQAVTYKYVTRNSLDAGLSLEYDYDAAIPRDDAFQLCFNTLQATMVSYDSNTSVSGPGFEWTVTSDAEQVDRTESDATAVKNYAGDNGDGFGTLQVCEKYYPTLTVTRGRDAFKRPGNTWSRNNVPVADVPDTPIKTYDGNFTGKDAKALSANGKVVLDQGANGVDVYYNGGAVNDTNTIQFKQDNALGAAPGAVSNGLWLSDAIGVPGYEVEVYKHVAGDTGTSTAKYDIIVREAYVGQISLIGTTPKDITVSVYEHGRVAAGGAVTLKVKAGGPATDADEHYNELAKYELGDYIAVYAKPGFEDTNLYTDASGVGGQTKTAGSTAVYDNAADAIAEIAPLSAEKVTIQRIDDNGKNVNSTVTTTAGTKYKINCAAVHAKGANVDNAKGAFATIENFTWAPSRNFNVGPATLYTFNGNVMIIDNSNGVTVVNKGYAYLYDWRDGSGDGDIKWESEGGNTTGTGASWVRMLTADGEYIEAPVADDSDAAIDNTALGTLVHYTYNKLNKDYTLKQICTDFSSDPTDQTNDAPGYAAGTSNKLSITSKKSEGTVPGSSTATKVAFDSGTKFIVVTTTPASGRIKKDWKTTANVYDIYDVPNISADSAKTFVTAAKVLDTNGDLQTTTAGAGTNLVTGVTDKVGVVLIIDAQSTVTADGYYFVLGTGKETKTRVLIDEDENVYYEYITYKAVVDGELTTVDVKVEDTRKAPGVTYPTALNNDEIKFVKNPIKDADDCIVGWGIEVDYAGQNGHVTDTNVIYDGTQVSEVEKDHITITASSTTNGDQEDYLASVAVGSVAYKYNAKDGVLEKVALKDIVATSTGSADNSDYHYAVRDKDHTTVYMLFIKVADKP